MRRSGPGLPAGPPLLSSFPTTQDSSLPFPHVVSDQSSMDSSSRRPGQSGAPVDPFLRYGLRVWLHLALGWSSRSLQCLSARSARLSLVRSWSRGGHGGHAGNRCLPTAAGVSDPEKNYKSRSGLCGRRGDPGSGRAVFCLADPAAGAMTCKSPGVVGALVSLAPTCVRIIPRKKLPIDFEGEPRMNTNRHESWLRIGLLGSGAGRCFR